MDFQSIVVEFLSMFLIIIFMVVFPDDAWARAGGRLARKVPWYVWVFGAPFVAWMGYKTAKVIKEKKQAAKALLDRIAVDDSVWQHDAIIRHIERLYFDLQDGWQKQDYAQVKSRVTAHLYDLHVTKLDRMKLQNIRNKMSHINLSKVVIVEVTDYLDDEKDKFKALIEGAMIDQLVNQSGQIIDGEKEQLPFEEIWHFVRQGDSWLLDRITEETGYHDIKALRSYSEAVGEIEHSRA